MVAWQNYPRLRGNTISQEVLIICITLVKEKCSQKMKVAVYLLKEDRRHYSGSTVAMLYYQRYLNAKDSEQIYSHPTANISS